MRGVLKPMLEILAGVPTVVLGFFAALTVAPLIRNTGEGFGLVGCLGIGIGCGPCHGHDDRAAHLLACR